MWENLYSEHFLLIVRVCSGISAVACLCVVASFLSFASLRKASGHYSLWVALANLLNAVCSFIDGQRGTVLCEMTAWGRTYGELAQVAVCVVIANRLLVLFTPVSSGAGGSPVGKDDPSRALEGGESLGARARRLLSHSRSVSAAVPRTASTSAGGGVRRQLSIGRKQFVIVWVLPLILSLIPFIHNSYGKPPGGKWCWLNSTGWERFHYLFLIYYLPLWVAIVYTTAVYAYCYSVGQRQMRETEAALRALDQYQQQQQQEEKEPGVRKNRFSGGTRGSDSTLGKPLVEATPSGGVGAQHTMHVSSAVASVQLVHRRLQLLVRKVAWYPFNLVFCNSFSTAAKISAITFGQSPTWLTIVGTVIFCLLGLLDSVAYFLTPSVQVTLRTWYVMRFRHFPSVQYAVALLDRTRDCCCSCGASTVSGGGSSSCRRQGHQQQKGSRGSGSADGTEERVAAELTTPMPSQCRSSLESHFQLSATSKSDERTSCKDRVTLAGPAAGAGGQGGSVAVAPPGQLSSQPFPSFSERAKAAASGCRGAGCKGEGRVDGDGDGDGNREDQSSHSGTADQSSYRQSSSLFSSEATGDTRGSSSTRASRLGGDSSGVAEAAGRLTTASASMGPTHVSPFAPDRATRSGISVNRTSSASVTHQNTSANRGNSVVSMVRWLLGGSIGRSSASDTSGSGACVYSNDDDTHRRSSGRRRHRAPPAVGSGATSRLHPARLSAGRPSAHAWNVLLLEDLVEEEEDDTDVFGVPDVGSSGHNFSSSGSDSMESGESSMWEDKGEESFADAPESHGGSEGVDVEESLNMHSAPATGNPLFAGQQQKL